MSFKKGFEKVAIVGPMVDLANLGIPSVVGYMMGKDKIRSQDPKAEYDTDAPSPVGKAAKYALIPGYTGYRLGTKAALREKAEKNQKDKK